MENSAALLLTKAWFCMTILAYTKETIKYTIKSRMYFRQRKGKDKDDCTAFSKVLHTRNDEKQRYKQAQQMSRGHSSIEVHDG